MNKELKLLRTLCEIHGPSGDESEICRFILNYVSENKKSWKTQPEIYSGQGWQDNIILKFGEPRTAVFAHMDTVGFTVRYENQLIPIGSPRLETGLSLRGRDHLGEIECTLVSDESNHALYHFGRPIATGTTLSFKPDFRMTNKYVSCCSMDNRLGVYNALRLAETLENGIIVFSTWEEHGGGSVPYLIKYINETWNVRQALVNDITWVTDGVKHGEGVVISLRDRNVPRKVFTDKITLLARKSGIPFQLEVEGSGSSDGRELQQSPFPIDWCFIGAPEKDAHSPNEKVHIRDISSMLEMYQFLMKSL